MAGLFIPPGGRAGFSQMSPASQIALMRSGRGGPKVKHKRRNGKKTMLGNAPKRRRRRKGAKSKGRKMKFGSPAWQRKYKVGKFAK